MSFEFKKGDIDGVVMIKPHIFKDDRGEYIKYFHEETFKTNNIPFVYTEFSQIFARKNSIRGLHYQSNNPQGKLIHLVSGKIFDVALDLRPNSETFGKYYAAELMPTDEALYIPAGFAHGFYALEDSIFIYESTGIYDADSSGAILWNDKELSIPWPILDYENLIISDKDKNAISFEDYIQEIRRKS